MRLLLSMVGLILALASGTELVLRDGTVLKGVAVQRLEENYILTLEDGEAITLPTGEAPTGMRTGEAETLVGETITPPTRREQLERLGPPSRFQDDVVDNSWQPSTDWDMDPDKNNNFAPSTWSEGPIDPEWKPKSAWDANKDVLASGRSEWRENIIDPNWSPKESFADSAGGR